MAKDVVETWRRRRRGGDETETKKDNRKDDKDASITEKLNKVKSL